MAFSVPEHDIRIRLDFKGKTILGHQLISALSQYAKVSRLYLRDSQVEPGPRDCFALGLSMNEPLTALYAFQNVDSMDEGQFAKLFLGSESYEIPNLDGEHTKEKKKPEIIRTSFPIPGSEPPYELVIWTGYDMDKTRINVTNEYEFVGIGSANWPRIEGLDKYQEFTYLIEDVELSMQKAKNSIEKFL